MENKTLPVVLVVYMDRDAFFAEQFLAELTFLRESYVVDLQRWSLSEEFTERESAEGLQSGLSNADVIVILASRNFSRAREIQSLLLRSIFELDKINVVIPVLLLPRDPESGWLREFNEPPLPISADSFFGERQSTDTDILYHEVVDAIVEKLINTFFPRPHRGVAQKTIFISYARKNFRRANVIRLAVQGMGYTTWMDKNNIKAGQNWVNRIDDGIRDAWCMLLIWSNYARSSEYVNYEWSFAMGNKTCVVPIMIETAKVHPRLAIINYLGWQNLTSAQYPWHELLQALNAAEWNYKNGTCNC